MFLANDVRIIVKGFAIVVFILGMFFPVVTIGIEAESTDSRLEPFDDNLVIIYTNAFLEGEIDHSNDEVSYTPIKQNNLLTWTFQVFLFLGIVFISLSLLADVLEKEEGFIGEWTSTFVGFVMLLILYLLIMLQVFLLESDLIDEDGNYLYDKVMTSRGTVSFYVNVEETILYRLLQIALASFLILPISNRLIKEKYPFTKKNNQEQPAKRM